MVKFSMFRHFRKLENFKIFIGLQYQKSQWNFIIFKFSAVSQIWKKYIQKLNDWDSALKSISGTN